VGCITTGLGYYAPWIARWASTDPIGVQAEIDLYAYGAESPIDILDPSGKAPNKYKDQRGRDTAAKAREMKKNLEEAKKKGYAPDPLQKRAEDMAKKRGKTPIEQHHHKGVKEAAKVKLDPKKMGDPMSSVWSTKRDPTVQAGIGDKPVWDPDFEGKRRTPHNVAKELDLAEQAKRPKTAKGLEDAAAASKQRLPATADLAERAKMDWTPSTPKGPPVDPNTGKVISKESKLLETGGEVLEHGKWVGRAAKGAKIIPFVGWGAGAASIGYNLRKGNYGEAVLDAVGFVPILGDAVDAIRLGLDFLPDLLGEDDPNYVSPIERERSRIDAEAFMQAETDRGADPLYIQELEQNIPRY
jgi:uncharacterized protein RhaS with RHS repeats